MDHLKFHELAIAMNLRQIMVRDALDNRFIYTYISDHEYRFGPQGEVPEMFWI